MLHPDDDIALAGEHARVDHQLMERVARGDAEAFRMLTERHATSVTAHAKRMLREASEAEDMVQEAFLRLWKNAPTYRAEARLGTYLHRIVHNLCVDALRARKPGNADALDGLASDERPSRELAVQSRAQRVHEEVKNLPERQRSGSEPGALRGADQRGGFRDFAGVGGCARVFARPCTPDLA